MSQPNTISVIYLKIGNGATPEVFAHDCTINSERGIQFQSQGQDVYVPDCDDPTALPWRQHFKGGLSATLSGSGVADADSLQAMDAWFRAPNPTAAKNVQVWCDDKGSWSGAFKLTEFQVTGDPTTGQPGSFTCTIESHGVVAPYDPA